MSEVNHRGGETTDDLAHIGHPKGTLAVLAIYMLLFILGWAALYFGEFLPRGTPDGSPNETTVPGTAVHGTAVPAAAQGSAQAGPSSEDSTHGEREHTP